MERKTLGVSVAARDSRGVVERIEQLEKMGIPAAWLTTGGPGLDALTLFAAAAVRTERIKFGTCIVPTWPRHPITAVQQVQVLAQLAPGRFRLGVGPSHKPLMTQMYGFEFRRPLTNLREYLQIVKDLLQKGSVDFDGYHYHAHARLSTPYPDVPVLASALQKRSFELCGAAADGAISWVCPGTYLRDVALPAMQVAAKGAGRPVPPLVAHAPVCVHDDEREVLGVAREQLPMYPRLPFYRQMFLDAGFTEAATENWSVRMVDAVVLYGKEHRVAGRIKELFALGATEIIVTVVTAGANREASRTRTLDLLANVVKDMSR